MVAPRAFFVTLVPLAGLAPLAGVAAWNTIAQSNTVAPPNLPTASFVVWHDDISSTSVVTTAATPSRFDKDVLASGQLPPTTICDLAKAHDVVLEQSICDISLKTGGAKDVPRRRSPTLFSAEQSSSSSSSSDGNGGRGGGNKNDELLPKKKKKTTFDFFLDGAVLPLAFLLGPLALMALFTAVVHARHGSSQTPLLDGWSPHYMYHQHPGGVSDGSGLDESSTIWPEYLITMRARYGGQQQPDMPSPVHDIRVRTHSRAWAVLQYHRAQQQQQQQQQQQAHDGSSSTPSIKFEPRRLPAVSLIARAA